MVSPLSHGERKVSGSMPKVEKVIVLKKQNKIMVPSDNMSIEVEAGITTGVFRKISS